MVRTRSAFSLSHVLAGGRGYYCGEKIKQEKNKMQTTNYLDLDDLQCKQKEVGYFQTTIKISVANRRGKNTIKLYQPNTHLNRLKHSKPC